MVIAGVCGSLLMGWQLVLSAAGILEAGERLSTAVSASSGSTCSFPIAVPGTCLIARYPVVYEGGYMEDGSGEYMVDVAAIVLFNTAAYGIEQARVVLQWEQGAYEFEVKMLPPRASVLVLEKSGQKYADHRWTECTGFQQTGEAWAEATELFVEEHGETALCIRNTVDRPLRDIRIYYKGYLPDDEVYLGGITYCTGIEELKPGESIILRPYRYVREYTKIVRICYAAEPTE